MKNRNHRSFVLAALLLFVLAFIWGNSLLDDRVSGTLSGWCASVLRAVFPGGSAASGDSAVRKAAHAVEFAVLGALLTTVVRVRMRKPLSLTLLCGLLIALIDETIQIFTNGRGSMVQDVWLDFGGFMVGFAFTLGVCRLLKRG